MSTRASRVRCFLLAAGLNHYVAQVFGDGTKITNPGTSLADGRVIIDARILRPSASEGSRRRLLTRRSGRLREPTSR